MLTVLIEYTLLELDVNTVLNKTRTTRSDRMQMCLVVANGDMSYPFIEHLVNKCAIKDGYLTLKRYIKKGKHTQNTEACCKIRPLTIHVHHI